MSTNESSKPQNKRQKTDFSDAFDIIVGEAPGPQRKFTIHHDLLTKHSEFLRAARSPQWCHDPTKPTKLVDDDPEVFAAYLNYIYFGLGSIKQFVKPFVPADSEDESEEEPNKASNERQSQFETGFENLIRIYIIADKLRDLATANVVIDEIMRSNDEHNQTPHRQAVVLAYTSTVSGNPLRNLLRDYWIHESANFDRDPLAEDVLAEFYLEIAMEFINIKKSHSPNCSVADMYWQELNLEKLSDKCRYHQHNEKHPRCVPEDEATCSEKWKYDGETQKSCLRGTSSYMI